jgi:hypothetical protein
MAGPVIPTVDPRRVVGVDVARALALVGMMATHILPGRIGNQVPLAQQLAGGRASALFAVLAGVSVALVSGRTRPVRGPARYAVSVRLVLRALLIGALGLALGSVPTVIAVILAYYGVLFLLAIPFVGLPARTLATVAAVWAVLAPIGSHLLRPHLPPHTVGSPTPGDLLHPLELANQLLFVGYYPAAVWLTYLLAGMAVGRLDLRRPGTDVRLLVGGGALAATAYLSSRLLLARPGARHALATTYPDAATPDPTLSQDPDALDALLTHGLHGTTPTDSWWWLAAVAPHSGTPFDLAHTTGSALAVLGACLVLTRAGRDVWAVVFGAGSMTLSLYSLHVLMMAQGYWPDWEAPAHFGDQVLVVAAVGAFFALVPMRGPLETAVSVLTRPTRRRTTHPRG